MSERNARLEQVLLTVLVLLGVPAIRYGLILAWRTRTQSYRARAVNGYNRLERLLAEKGIRRKTGESCEQFAQRVEHEEKAAEGYFTACQELALRAAFGKERIQKDELKILEQTYVRIREKLLAESSFLKKIYLRYWKIY